MRLSERRTMLASVMPSVSIIGEANSPYYCLLYVVKRLQIVVALCRCKSAFYTIVYRIATKKYRKSIALRQKIIATK